MLRLIRHDTSDVVAHVNYPNRNEQKQRGNVLRSPTTVTTFKVQPALYAYRTSNKPYTSRKSMAVF
jgi:hypothetical protein